MFLELSLKAMETLGVKLPGGPTNQMADVDKNDKYLSWKLGSGRFMTVGGSFLQGSLMSIEYKASKSQSSMKHNFSHSKEVITLANRSRQVM